LATRTFELEGSGGSVPSKPKSESFRLNAGTPLANEDSVPSKTGLWDSVTAVPQTKNSNPTGRRLLRIEGASVEAGATRILNSITFEVHAGEHWLITGPNGSGKSTLLALLLWDHPQSYLANLEVLGLRATPGTTRFERQRGIGFMAPELAMHYPPGWPVRDVVTSGFMATIGSYAEPSGDERAIAEQWMQRLGLDVVAETPFGRLSEAEQRRALLARALVRAPRLLFLDEPTQGLSSMERRNVHDVLDAVVESNDVTLLLVSHHPEERPRCLSHHLALRLGCIVHNGPLTTDSSVDPAAHG